MKILAGIVLAASMMVSIAFANFDPYNVATTTQATVSSCEDDSVHFDQADFCDKFNQVAICHCDAKTPAPMRPLVCKDMKTIHSNMLSLYGSDDNACRAQQDTSHDTCMNDWKCAESGGSVDGKQCSGTGQMCPQMA